MSVIENPDDQRMLVIDGFGASGENHTGTLYMEWMGRLPMLLHDDPQEALVICFGTGQNHHRCRRGPRTGWSSRSWAARWP